MGHTACRTCDQTSQMKLTRDSSLSLIFYPVGMTRLGLNTFEAKIGLENEASIGMFKKIHFKEVC